MLGRLFSSPARSVAESFIEEAHTKELIFPREPIWNNSPSTDIAPDLSGVLPFDYIRFELNETRCLIAQDASASQNACILFDSKASGDATIHSPTITHRRGNLSVFGRAPSLRQPPVGNGSRNRSSTLSNIPMQEAEPKDNSYTGMLLECMFGAPSTAKGGNSTKMHIINANSDRISHSMRRTPFNRAQTSANLENVYSKPATLSEYSESSSPYDIVLITRTFTVNLPDDVRESSSSANAITSPNGYSAAQAKQTKLKKTKSPAFAVAIVVRLPSLAPARPISRHLNSLSSSHSSWTILDALPSSLASTRCFPDRADNCIEQLVENFHIIERSLLTVEQVARVQILELLKAADAQALSTVAKAPKEKAMQRTNQRFVQLIPDSLLGNEKIHTAAKQALKRASHGAKINRVTVGLGLLPGGRFLDELRTVSKSCPTVFVYTLLTAYLGLISPDWLARLKRSKGYKLEAQYLEVQNARTIIISDNRSTARRIIFLLASFLEGRGDAFNPVTKARTALSAKPFALQSPPHSFSRQGELRRTALSRSNAETSGGPLLSATSLSSQAIDNIDTDHYTGPSNAGGISKRQLLSPTETKDSATSLANLLRRSSSLASSNAPSQGSTKWGSLLSGFFRADSTGTSVTTVPGSRKSSIETPASDPVKLEGHGKDLASRNTGSDVLPIMTVPMGSGSSDEASISLPQPIPPRLQVDQNDGVIDVDLSSIPGFLSSSDTGLKSPLPLMSPRTPSMRSLDGGSSIYSARSHADAFSSKLSPDQIHAAGFLKFYHQDFMLQAVKPYQDLLKEIKISMSSDPTPRSLCVQSATDEEPRWLNVSTTLVADVRDQSVTRIQLRRRIMGLSTSASPAGKLQNQASPPFKSDFGNTDNFTNEPLEEAFFSDTVQGFDRTLADAIDRALEAHGPRISSGTLRSAHSRTVSSSSIPTVNTAPPSAPRVIVDALQEVVESVDRELHHKDATNSGQHGPSSATVPKSGAKEENALREGVKRWMECVEHREVW